ncbi:hypothetical protein [Richelia sinica]|nr:hypothetical protein [Richelia sinica]MBD2664407.1 hypothetical protein [Richelia sinica FACHB-800]
MRVTIGAIIRLTLLFLSMLAFAVWLKQSGAIENAQLLETLYRQGNYIEAVLWTLFAIAFLVYSYKRPSVIAQRKNQFTALVFFLFGLSDVVEVQTGGWWKPWWLFLWKASCVITLIACFGDYWRNLPSKHDS